MRLINAAKLHDAAKWCERRSSHIKLLALKSILRSDAVQLGKQFFSFVRLVTWLKTYRTVSD